MQIRDEFNRLMNKFRQSVESKSSPNLVELFKDSLRLFERLKEMLTYSNEEEKKEILKMMAEMHDFLGSETKKLAEKTGMSEDQMLRFAENPDNFTPEQWRTLEMVRDRLGRTANEMSRLVKKKPEGSSEGSSSGPSGSEAVARDPNIKKPKHSKKDRWMKS